MPGTITFKPIEANLTHNTDLITKMNPYCAIEVGNNKVSGEICKKGGKHPHWNDTVTLPIDQESQALVKLMDKGKITHDDNIGSFTMDLDEVQRSGKVSKWYPLYYKTKNAGEILIEAVFQAEGSDQKLEDIQQKEQERSDQPEIVKEEGVANMPEIKKKKAIEPATVISIQVAEPEVVPQEIKVIEPKLGTKTIEDIGDTRQEEETSKAQSFTEKIIVAKEMEETQPIAVKKIEEPINKNETASKEIHEPVALDEKGTVADPETKEVQREGLEKGKDMEKENMTDEMNISQGLSKLENNTFVAEKRDRPYQKSPEKKQKIVDDLI